MCLRKIGGLLQLGLKKVDLFPAKQFIKYNKQSQYTTATGGFVSLGLIIIILILFSSKGIQTLERSAIISKERTQIEIEPTLTKIAVSPSGGFMFAIGIHGLDLLDPSVTYFKIQLVQNSFSPLFNLTKQTQVPLAPCTANHFAFNKDVLSQFQKLNVTYALCPRLGQEFQIGGRITSSIYKQFKVIISKCDTSLVSNCASDALISSIDTFTLTIPVVNNIVNANEEQFVKTFIQDRNYFPFTPSNGININAQIASYQVETDISIMPYTQVVTNLINTIPNLFSSRNYQVKVSTFATVSFSKSSHMKNYKRSFNKLDNYLSYIGGIVSSSLVLFFLLRAYSQRSFFIDIASKILPDKDSYSLKKFNFLDNLGVMLKEMLETIKIEVNWPKIAFMARSIYQMEQQLDVCLLIKRLEFLEEAISSVLSEHQLETLFLKDKRSIDVIQKWRVKHKLPKLIKNHPHEITQVQLQNQDVISSDFIQSQNQNQLVDKMKVNVEKVINQSKNKDVITKRIIKKLDHNILETLGFYQGGYETSENNSIKGPNLQSFNHQYLIFYQLNGYYTVLELQPIKYHY